MTHLVLKEDETAPCFRLFGRGRRSIGHYQVSPPYRKGLSWKKHDPNEEGEICLPQGFVFGRNKKFCGGRGSVIEPDL